MIQIFVRIKQNFSSFLLFSQVPLNKMYGILFWTCSVSAVTIDPLLDKSIITNFTDIIQVHCTVYIQPLKIEN